LQVAVAVEMRMEIPTEVVVVQVAIVNLLANHWLLEHPIRLLLVVAVLPQLLVLIPYFQQQPQQVVDTEAL
jgi:hypothetical protein